MRFLVTGGIALKNEPLFRIIIYLVWLFFDANLGKISRYLTLYAYFEPF